MASLRPAASVVLVRPGGEVFWVRRGDQLNFAGGFYAFPGGRVDEADAGVPVNGSTDAVERMHLGAAARELFEETGVLAVTNAARVPAEERREVRERLVERSARKRAPDLFARFLEKHGAVVEAKAFVPAGRWITPPTQPTRFDARFYLHVLQPGEVAEVWPGELADGEWIRPAQALAQWDAGTALLHPPAWHTLRSLDGRSVEDALPLLQDPARASWRLPIEDFVVQRMEFQRGLLLVPLRTPTLAPATHTNALLLGDEKLWVVDPGSPYPEEQAVLDRALDDLAQDGRRPEAILLTHYHHDHVAGAMPLSARLGLPIVAHAETAARLQGDVRVDRLLDDGAPLPVGPRGWRVLHLPGHTRGHLCLIEEGSGAVAAGDLVSGLSTVVIDPPEGDMHDYVHSLQRLLDLGPRAIYPAHGPVVPGGAERLRFYLSHRREREERVVAALEAARGPATPEQLVAAAYPDVAADVYPLAQRSLLAHLLKLVKDGRATQSGDAFALA